MRKNLDQADLKGKKVLLRVDLNVPVTDGKISDYTRMDRILPTLEELHQKGAKTIIISHFGRPKGQVNPSMSLDFLKGELSKRCDYQVGFASNISEAKELVDGMQDGDILLLENIRFHPGEEANDKEFAKDLAKLGDIYINDAFSCAHRAHASTEAIAHLMPAYAGRSLEAELAALEGSLENPKKPVMAIVGGSKVSTKLAVLENLVSKVQMLVVGGAMANTFLEAKGVSVGRSLVEKEMLTKASEIMAKAEKEGCRIILPIDAVVAPAITDGEHSETVDINAVPADKMILDVGPKSVADIEHALDETKTLVWNGPLGAFEFQPFDEGTFAIAHYVAKLTQDRKLFSVAGGGDTVASLQIAGEIDSLDYVSTAGGAFLEWMEGKELPGVKALEA